METRRNGLIKVYHVVVMGLFAAILLLLGIFAACSTSYIQADASELTYFVEDSVWMNLAAVAAVLAMAVFLKKIPTVQKMISKVETDEEQFLKYRNHLLCFGFLLAVFWVLSTQYRAGADQAQVQKAVYMLHIKDYSMFAEAGYLSKYPNQLGLVWISYLLSLIFGSYNYVCFQLLNAVGLAVIYKKMAEIGAHAGHTRMMQLAVILGGMLFVPLTMYSSFVYGNVLGLAFSLAALEREMTFFDAKRKKDAIVSAVLIAIAIQFKSNYLIFLIGMVIYAGAEWIHQKQFRLLAVPVLLVAGCLASSMAVNAVTEHVTGYSMDRGVSSWSWIAMGLQEGKRAPGWYNGYNSSSYIESEYDSAVQAEAAKENILESMERFSEDKWKALQFFTEKTASQWNNPTFQAFWNVQVRSMAVTESDWSWNMTSVTGAHQWAQILNLVQFVILSGAMAGCIFGRDRACLLKQTVLAMIFVGGFVFHLFWEAKCQYTITYFVLLIPYAVSGFASMAEKMETAISGKIRSSGKQWFETFLEKQFGALVFAFLVVNMCIFAYGGGKLDYLKEDTVDYLNYLEAEGAAPAAREGVFRLQTEDGLILALGALMENGSSELIVLDPATMPTSIDCGIELEVINHQETTWLRFVPELRYLTVSDRIDPERYLPVAAKSNLLSSQQWQTKQAAAGGIYLMYGKNHAMTYVKEEGQLYVAPFVGDSSQIWYLNE